MLSPLSELQRTELLVLGLVGWELAAPTSLDFLPLVAAVAPAIYLAIRCVRGDI